jgi:valyl-tRNA synthetase
MWLNQNEIHALWQRNKGNDVRVDFRLFAPNNATILTKILQADNCLGVGTYHSLLSLQAFVDYKQQEKKENVMSLIGMTQHYSEHEKELRKQATEFDKTTNKYIYDPSKIDYLAMSYEFYRQQKWKKLLGKDSAILKNQISSINNVVVDEVWSILDTMRNRELIFENLKLNFYNPKKQYYVTEAETKKIAKTGKVHYLKYRIEKDDAFKITNIILDQINDSLAKHITYQNDIIDRIKLLIEKKPKKSSIKDILGLSKKEYEEFDNGFKQKDLQSQKDLEYLQGHLIVVEQNVKTLKKIKTILLHQYETSILVGFENLWHSVFTLALSIKPSIDYSIFYLSKTKELVIVAECEAVQTLSILLEDNIINTPEVIKKVEQFKDSNDFFTYLNVGIQKIASISGKELEGLKIQLVGDVDIDNLDYNSRGGIGKVILDNNENTLLNITPIHQFNIDTFRFLNELSFPILNKLSNQGKLINMGNKFASLENYIASYSENYLVEIYERDGDYFNAKTGVQIERIYSMEDSVTELYPLPEKNWFINFPNPTSLASRNEWAMPLPLFKNENKVLWVSDLEDLAKKSINPIYRMVLGKNLKYEFFESSKAVLISDSISKIPLGLSTTQYRSKVLTNLRKEKRIEWSVFCAYADKLYEEILELFQKFEVVQVQLTAEESVKWQNWFFGKDEDYITDSNTVLYFYNKIKFEEEIIVDKSYNYLNLQKNSLSDLYIKDQYDNVYNYSGLTIDYAQEEKLLDIIVLKQAFEGSNSVYYAADKEHISNVLENYEFVYSKQKKLTAIPLPTIKMSGDIDKYLQRYEADQVKLVLFKEEKLTEEDLEEVMQQEILLADNLNRFFFHRASNYDGNKESVLLWFNSKTNDLQNKIESYSKDWNTKLIYQGIYQYILDLNELVFPILKNVANNDKAQAQSDLINVLNNFIYIIKPYLPVLAEKIFQVIYEDKMTTTNEYHLVFNTLKPAGKELTTKMEALMILKNDLVAIRKLNNIPYYQGLYADFGYLKEDQIFAKYIQIYLNLIPKSLMNVEGQIEKLQFMNCPLIVDLVLDVNLLTIACQKELSKIIINWKTNKNYKLKQLVKIQIRYDSYDNHKVMNKLKLNSYWPDIFTETVWADDKIDKNDDTSYKLLDIAKVSLKEIT